MRVKIGNTWYDGEQIAICVALTDEDKTNIANMEPGTTKYASFPDSDPRSSEQMLNWMRS